MGRDATLVQRQSRHHGHIVYGGGAKCGGDTESTASGGDVRDGGPLRLLLVLDAPQRRARAALPHLYVPYGDYESAGARESGPADGSDGSSRQPRVLAQAAPAQAG